MGLRTGANKLKILTDCLSPVYIISDSTVPHCGDAGNKTIDFKSCMPYVVVSAWAHQIRMK